MSSRSTALALLLLSCSKKEAPSQAAAVVQPTASATQSVAAPPEAPPAPPPPPAPPAKPELTTKQLQSVVYERPTYESLHLGYIRAGFKVARKEEPVPEPKYRGPDGLWYRVPPCGGKWYEIEPAGFVCVGQNGVTLDMNDPAVLAAQKFPPKDDPLPYAYGMSHGAHLYSRIPTADEQRIAEGDVAYWRKTMAEMRAKTPPEKLTPEIGLPIGPIPDILANHAAAPMLQPWYVASRNPKVGFAMPATRLAFAAAFMVDDRPFYLTSEMVVVPVDRFKNAKPSEFGGVELKDKEKLPMVWVRFPRDKQPATVYRIEGEKAVKTDTVLPEKWHGSVADKDIVVKGVGKFHELLEPPMDLPAGKYAVKMSDVARVDAVKELRDGIKPDEVWVDVDISRQVLVMYKGKEPFFTTLVSSGSGGKKRYTPTGAFRIYQKHWTTKMSAEEKPPESAGDEKENAYRFDDVPYVQYIYAGIAFHAAFWHDRFGTPQSHGCINLSPKDAKYVFEHTEPKLAKGWHAVYGGRGPFPVGTLVVIHT